MQQYKKCETICQVIFVVKKDVYAFEKILQGSQRVLQEMREIEPKKKEKSNSHLSERILEMWMNENI